MNILITINKTYIKQANILINSIQNSNSNEKFNIYVLHRSLNKKDIEALKYGIMEDKINIIDIKIPKTEIDSFPIYEKRYSIEIYFRLFATKYLPKDLDRVLYLDADTLVINNISTLYNTDFENNYYVATTHIGKVLHKFNEIRLNLKKDEPYINTGVLLINLKELRKINVEYQVINYIKKNKNILMLPDQDILAAMFGDKIKLVNELKYNLGDRGLTIYNINNPQKKINLKWICKNTVIVHYYGKNKPWNKNYSGILDCFYKRIENQTYRSNKVLILSCGTGGGHNTAAKAIQERLIESGIQADLKEYLDIINVKIKNTVNNLYLKSTTKQGKTFKKIYKLGEMYQKTKIKSPVYAVTSLSKKKLYSYIKENKYDYIVTTHLFAAQALTAIKKEHKIRFIAIATDYVSIPFWEETNPDYLVIPSKELNDDFLKKGIKQSKLLPLGIPVRKNFSEDYDKYTCRDQLNLSKYGKYILILTGSMGFGNTQEMAEKLADEISDAVIIVSCGTNKELKKSLDASKFKNILPLEYREDIHIYMKSSDVVLSKPGGLTTTEIATLRKPFIHTNPIPGCETYNAEFFSKMGMSLKSETIEQIVSNTKLLLNNKQKQQELIKQQENYIDKHSAEKIAQLIITQMEIGKKYGEKRKEQQQNKVEIL